MSGTVTPYLQLVPSANGIQPKFIAELTALLQPVVAVQNLIAGTPAAFDLDTAAGAQLDAVGQWVGRTRQVNIPLGTVYFSFDTTGLGWDQGDWEPPYAPSSGVTSLNDHFYRILLRAVIAANQWDGTLKAAISDYGLLFDSGTVPGTILIVQDNQDMTITLGIAETLPDPVFTALLDGGYFPMKPAGVTMNFMFVSVNNMPLFGFDVENAGISGWDTGAWGILVSEGPAGSGQATFGFDGQNINVSGWDIGAWS